jgi:hypothetical protein
MLRELGVLKDRAVFVTAGLAAPDTGVRALSLGYFAIGISRLSVRIRLRIRSPSAKA